MTQPDARSGRRASTVRALRGDSRTGRAARGSLASAAERLVLAATSIVTVPVLLANLGMETYGFWVTAVTLMNWVALFHLGVPESLLNRTATAPDGNIAYRAALSTTAFWLMSALAVASLATLALLLVTDMWAALMNAGPATDVGDARSLLVVMWLGLAVSMPMRVPMAILRGDQRVDLVSIANSAGTLGRLLAIFAAVWMDVSVMWLVVLATLPPLVPLMVVTVQVFGRRVPWPRLRDFDRTLGRGLLATGIGFAGISIATLVTTSTDVILVAQILGPAAVPTYSVPFALLALFTGVEIAVMRGVWPGYAHAAASADGAWIRTTHRRLTSVFVVSSLVFGVVLVLAGPALIEAWAGPEVRPPVSLLVAFAVIAVIQSVEVTHGHVLAATGWIRRLTTIGIIGVVVNIPVSIGLGREFGVTGIALGTVAALALVVVMEMRATRTAIAQIEAMGVSRT